MSSDAFSRTADWVRPCRGPSLASQDTDGGPRTTQGHSAVGFACRATLPHLHNHIFTSLVTVLPPWRLQLRRRQTGAAARPPQPTRCRRRGSGRERRDTDARGLPADRPGAPLPPAGRQGRRQPRGSLSLSAWGRRPFITCGALMVVTGPRPPPAHHTETDRRPGGHHLPPAGRADSTGRPTVSRHPAAGASAG